MKQELKWNEETNETDLIIENDDRSISVEPLTPQEAAEWQAENRF